MVVIIIYPTPIVPFRHGTIRRRAGGYRTCSDNFSPSALLTGAGDHRDHPHRPIRRWNDASPRRGYRTCSEDFFGADISTVPRAVTQRILVCISDQVSRRHLRVLASP